MKNFQERKTLKDNTERKKIKKPYFKPLLKKVRLTAKESILQSCKATQGFLWN